MTCRPRLIGGLSAFIILVSTIALTGCITTTEFVQIRPVPAAPSFTVLPANEYLDEVEFARRIEAALVAAGVSVLSAPGTAFITKETTLRRGIASESSETKAEGSREEKETVRFLSYDNLEADYVVSTIYSGSGNGQVRIELRKTREVVTVFRVRYYSGPEDVEGQVKDAVEAILRARPDSPRVSM